MAEVASHLLIEPTSFDLVVVGTGLPESILAAGASFAGKSVLHLDPNPYYGSHFSSFTFDSFVQFLESQRNIPSIQTEPSTVASSSGEYVAVEVASRPLYSDIEISSHVSQTLEPSRSFSIDLSGPRVMFCAEPMVDLMLKSGASHHIEFKSVDGSFIYIDGKLAPVPDSREAIFKDRSLGLVEKSQMMRFFKLAQEHFGAKVGDGEEGKRISEEDLESPLVEFLKKQRLPSKIKSIILYAISMADYDQDNREVCKNLLRTKDGIESLALYHASVGRFPNALGAFIYPIYGQGELPQAFCRCAAVKGALYVLRMPVTGLLIDKESNLYKGVSLASGQVIFSQQLVMDPSIAVPPPVSSLRDLKHEVFEGSCPGEVRNPVEKIARGVCITRGSIKPDLSNMLVVFPPRSLHADQVTSVRALQLSNNVAVCPSGLFILYLSTLCDNAIDGKGSLHAAMNALFTVPVSGVSEVRPPIPPEDDAEVKPTLLWSAMYVQEVMEGNSLGIVNSCPMPDANLDYRDLLKLTTKLFQKMFHQEEIITKTEVLESSEVDDVYLLKS